MMWNCPKCGEGVEASFEVCWNCGTGADGTPDPDFRRVEEPPGGVLLEEVADDRPAAPRLSGTCRHCGATDLVGPVSFGNRESAAGLRYKARVFYGCEPLVADLCLTCGTVARLYVRDPDQNWAIQETSE